MGAITIAMMPLCCCWSSSGSAHAVDVTAVDVALETLHAHVDDATLLYARPSLQMDFANFFLGVDCVLDAQDGVAPC